MKVGTEVDLSGLGDIAGLAKEFETGPWKAHSVRPPLRDAKRAMMSEAPAKAKPAKPRRRAKPSQPKPRRKREARKCPARPVADAAPSQPKPRRTAKPSQGE
eukprot:gene43128-16326_t